MKTRYPVLLVLFLLFSFLGCQSRPRSEKMDVLTHTFAPWQVSQLPDWERTIKTTVVPEKWNEENSPHRISVQGATMTVRTTRENQKVILTYLHRVMSAPVVPDGK